MAARQPIRVMTYNVHSCVGTDRKLSPERIAEVIAQCKPDIVALQELDVGRARSGRIDQAHAIASKLEMQFHFHPAFQVEEEKYGDAILSPHPMNLIHAAALPTFPARRPLQRRGALWVVVEIQGHEIHMFNTHFGLNRHERVAQAEALLGEDWARSPRCRVPTLLCGDFNAIPASRAYRRLAYAFPDVRRQFGRGTGFGTYPTGYPMLWIDHIFASPDLRVTGMEIPRTPLTRVASDHFPLVAELELPATPTERATE